MTKNVKITDEDRNFITLVADATYHNPFSEKWGKLVLEIAGSQSGTPREEVRHRLAEVISQRVQKIETQGIQSFSQFKGKDQRLMESFFVFETYYQFIDRFDQLITNQLAAGDAPCSVNFAAEAIGTLVKRGFYPDRAVRLFAMFYQTRRAFYFIDRALLGRSALMQKLRFQLWNNVFTHDVLQYDRYLVGRMEDFSTIILGDTGSGKGTAAGAIGRSGFIPFDENKRQFKESFTKAFIAVNLSQYHEQLIESELFGHKKGSFTGAVETYDGVFSRCSPYGAIFLDEIGEVSIPIQIKLLQVLEERFFYPVGSHEQKRFSGRIIAATNQSINTLRAEGRFRDDFFYRLSSDVIIVPTLAERLQENREELDLLIQHILRKLTGEEDTAELFSLIKRAFKEDLPKNYNWPGNVRELEQAIRRVVLTNRYLGERRYTPSDMRAKLLKEFEEGELPARDVLSAYCALLYTRYPTYEAVSQRTNLDRRTVKKHIQEWTEKHQKALE